MKKTIKNLFLIVLLAVLATAFSLFANAEYRNGQIISFGSYPQKAVTNSALIESLDEVPKEWKLFSFPSSDPEPAVYYSDFEYDSKDYRAIRTVSPRNKTQNKNGYSIGETYYFYFQPVTWVVINAEKGLVWSKYIIDAQNYNNTCFFNETDSLMYKDSDCSVLFSSWKDSDIRRWLNKDFYQTAFSTEEKNDIIKTDLLDSGCEDRVFLLSCDEYNTYANKYEPKTKVNGSSISAPIIPSPSDYSLALGFKNPLFTFKNKPYTTECLNTAQLRSVFGDPELNYSLTQSAANKTIVESGSAKTAMSDETADYVLSELLFGTRPAVCLNSVRGVSCEEHGAEFVETKTENSVLPTCENSGSHDYVIFCAECGNELYRETIIDSPSGHDYMLVDETSLLCNSADPVVYRCRKCGDEYTDENPIRIHTFGDYISNNDATCTEDGTKTAKCEYCDATDTITDTGTELGHDLKTYIVKKGSFESVRDDELYDGSLKWKYVEGRQYKHCSRCNRDYPGYPIGFYARVSGPWAEGIGLFNNSPNYYMAQYTGKPVTLDFELYMEIANEYIPLVEGKDYTVKYKNNTAPGYGAALLEFDNEYISGTCGMNMRILAELQNVRMIMDGTNLTVKWDPIVGSPKLNISLYKCGDWENQTIKTTNKNYVTFENVVPNESYEIQYWMDDKGLLYKKSFSFHTNEFECEKAVYTGKEIKPAITVKNSEGEILTENEDYTIRYSNNKNVGIAKATIKMKSSPKVPESEINTYDVLFRIIPQQVKGLKMSSAGKDSIKLSWSKVTGAEKYMLYQSIDGKTWTKVKTVTGNSATFKELKTGQIYQYKVRAHAVSGFGKYSSVLKTQTKTAAPTKLSVSAVSATGVRFGWKAVFGATKYIVFMSADGGKTWSKAKTVKTNAASISKLASGKKYQFRVVSCGLAGKSEDSAVLKTGTLTAAAKISKLTSTKVKTATVKWDKVTGAKSYIVYTSKDGKKFKKATTTTKTTVTLSKLTAGKKVYVKIAAVNAYGKKSAYSSAKSVTVKK